MTTATQVQLRRGTAVQVAAFTPAEGEPIFDKTNHRLVMGDGATAGGFPQATEAYVLTQIAALSTGLFQNEYLFDNCE
jgi:hypothetical protein